MMCYYFPPIHSVGAHRSVGFATHLKELGWAPTILTVTQTRIPWERTNAPVPPGLDIVRAPEWNLHRAVALADAASARLFRMFGRPRAPRVCRSSFWMPDTQIAWRAVRAGVRIARQADCVYVSCSPCSAAVFGATVARRTRKPLVLDFRDPWGGRGLQPLLQRFALSRADAVILNTPRTLAYYQKRFPDLASRMVAIPNGFDTLPETRPATPRTGAFTIMHVGEFYGSRQPDVMLEVLAELNLPGLEFVQVGPAPTALARIGSSLRVRHIERVPRAEAVALMQSASLLYLRMHHEEYFAPMIVPAKAYEYLTTGVPILAECGDGDPRDLISKYGTHAEVVGSGNRDEIRAAVLRAYNRRHEPPDAVNPLFVERYHRRALTKRLADVLEAVVTGAGLPPAMGL
jgi:glycosyltransferase involved in cell wall biosynthesis